MWQLYWHFGPKYLDSNQLDAHTALPEWWADPNPDAVSAECLRQAMAGVRDRGWTHHIQRLMVLGNHALQRGYHPRALSDWFASSFVDGFAWVMPTNVIGMSQHADGGRVATKPYASGGAYINRMSDHCRHCPFDPANVWVRMPARSPPVTGPSFIATGTCWPPTCAPPARSPRCDACPILTPSSSRSGAGNISETSPLKHPLLPRRYTCDGPVASRCARFEPVREGSWT